MDETRVLDLGSNTDRPDWQDTRLAELVLHLTGCTADEAMLAVADRAPDVAEHTDPTLDPDEARVARALLRIRKTRTSEPGTPA
jgi:hypothetical protein